MRQRLSMVEGGAQYGYNKAELSAEEAKRSATHELEGPVKQLPSLLRRPKNSLLGITS
jgi:hypothetical protein